MRPPVAARQRGLESFSDSSGARTGELLTAARSARRWHGGRLAAFLLGAVVVGSAPRSARAQSEWEQADEQGSLDEPPAEPPAAEIDPETQPLGVEPAGERAEAEASAPIEAYETRDGVIVLSNRGRDPAPRVVAVEAPPRQQQVETAVARLSPPVPPRAERPALSRFSWAAFGFVFLGGVALLLGARLLVRRLRRPRFPPPQHPVTVRQQLLTSKPSPLQYGAADLEAPPRWASQSPRSGER